MSNEELKTIEEIKQLANIIDVSAKELQTGLRNLLIAKESECPWYWIPRREKIVDDVVNRDINSIVHEKIQRLIADTPTVEDAVQVVRCKDCVHFEDAKVNAKGFLICPNTGMDIWDECYCAHGEKRIIDNDVAEQCPECSNLVWLKWDVERDGYTIYCPYCGYRMKLCSMCDVRDGGKCDWNSETVGRKNDKT